MNKNKLNLHLAKERKICTTLEINKIAGKTWEKSMKLKALSLKESLKLIKNLAIVVKGKVGKDPRTTNDRIKN